MQGLKCLILEGICLAAVFLGCSFLGMSGKEPDHLGTIAEVEAGQTQEEGDKDYIRWVDFNVTSQAMEDACQWDISTYGRDIHLNWIELLACLGARYGGGFKSYRSEDMENLAEKLTEGTDTIASVTANLQYYDYYLEAYEAVLGGLVGLYEREVADDAGQKSWEKVYGLKACSPIAAGFEYSDYDDFGVSRTYGYERRHLGHDMMGLVGTPVIAVESGYVSALGWNQYGGWRIGISSFDGKRYYYYAHLRQNRPYAQGLEVGDVVLAGDVIGYMGRTGYSKEENVNNIKVNHLHFGLQLIFDESQREGANEIWIDVYPIVKFLEKKRSQVQRNDETKEWSRTLLIRDPEAERYIREQGGDGGLPDKNEKAAGIHGGLRSGNWI